MKYLLPAIILCFFTSMSVAAQVPAATVPDFTFYKFNKTAFANKDLSAGKILFFVFFDTECDHCQHLRWRAHEAESAFASGGSSRAAEAAKSTAIVPPKVTSCGRGPRGSFTTWNTFTFSRSPTLGWRDGGTGLSRDHSTQ